MSEAFLKRQGGRPSDPGSSSSSWLGGGALSQWSCVHSFVSFESPEEFSGKSTEPNVRARGSIPMMRMMMMSVRIRSTDLRKSCCEEKHSVIFPLWLPLKCSCDGEEEERVAALKETPPPPTVERHTRGGGMMMMVEKWKGVNSWM